MMTEQTEQPSGGRTTRLVCDRTLWTLVVGAVLVVLIGLAGSSRYPGMYPKDYERMLVRWSGEADAVVVGDSRVMSAASPEAMSTELPDLRIRNYSWGGLKYSREFLVSVRGVLDAGSQRRIVVLGLSPASLTGLKTGEVDGFVSARNNRVTDISHWEEIKGRVLSFTEPMSPRGLVYSLAPGLRKKWSTKVYHRDGWVACDAHPRRPTRALAHYRLTLKNRPVPDETLTMLSEFIRQCHTDGITVYAFRPPTTPEMERLEESMTGYDTLEIATLIEAAGGVWLDGWTQSFETYDGSHLTADAAVPFSKELARKIVEHQPVRD